MDDKNYSNDIDNFLMVGNIFVVKQIFGDFKIIIAIFKEKQEAEKYLEKRDLDYDQLYEIDTVVFEENV